MEKGTFRSQQTQLSPVCSVRQTCEGEPIAFAGNLQKKAELVEAAIMRQFGRLDDNLESLPVVFDRKEDQF